MKNLPSCGIAVAFVLSAISFVSAATYYVSPSGHDDADGSAQAPMASIAAAGARLQPGDTLIVAEGVYFGPVQIAAKGTAENPITIRAASNKLNAVIITNADRTIRGGQEQWKLEDASLGMYSAALDHYPARVLYSGVDLQPYADLEQLRTFTVTKGYPGPVHGFTFDPVSQRLYVRLRADGHYGPADPAQHLMAVAPATGLGSAGHRPGAPTFANLTLTLRDDLYVIVDGFTFETPGCAGVLINGHHVTVRNCWFRGCRVGVSGLNDNADPAKTSNYVTVEYCDFSQYPALDDTIEIVKTGSVPPSAGPKAFPIYWWSRKGDYGVPNLTYEMGILNLAGHYWEARNNYIHDAFEAFSVWTVEQSHHLKIHNNVMERLVDNAVESENHAVDMHVYNNLMLEVAEPISWQPLDGMPWPGPVYVHHNIMVNSREFNELLGNATRSLWKDWRPGLLKAGAAESNWNYAFMHDAPKDFVESPGGFYFYNNTAYFPGGNFLTRPAPAKIRFRNFHIYNNIFVGTAYFGDPIYDSGGLEFRRNIWAKDDPANQNPADVLTANGGLVLASPELLNFRDIATRDFTPAANSPALMMPSQEGYQEGDLPYSGAVAPGERWVRPIVGPQSGVGGLGK